MFSFLCKIWDWIFSQIISLSVSIMDDLKLQLLDALISKNSGKACEIVANPACSVEFLEFAITKAVRYNDAKVLDLSLTRCDHDKDLHLSYGPERVTMLQYACDLDYLECVKCLHKHGADLNAISPDGHTALTSAVASESVQCIRWLITEMKAKEPPGFFAFTDVIFWTRYDGRMIVEIMNLLLDNGFHLKDAERDIVSYMQYCEFDDVLVLKMMHLHNITVPTGKMIGIAFLKEKIDLTCHMLECEGVLPEIQLPSSAEGVSILSYENSVHLEFCVYLIRRYHFVDIVHEPYVSVHGILPETVEEMCSGFYEECRKACIAERVRPRMAFAGCTHKRLGSECPIQQFLDVEMLSRIEDLSFSERKTLKISFCS